MKALVDPQPQSRFSIANIARSAANWSSAMSITHITSHSIRRLLTLTEKKEQFLKGIEEVENEIAKTLTGARAAVVKAVTPSKPRAKKRGKKTTKSGGLKDRILALLHSAGGQGLKVKEIAEKLATKPGNIAVWFSTTGKKLVNKVEPGRYAIKRSKPAPKSVAPVAKAAKSKKKGGITPEGRAKLAANMKARWAARKAGKPAKKGFKLPKSGKNPF
jgi:hypothetical protein